MLYILLLLAIQANAREQERVLNGHQYKSRFVVAGYIVQCDTLPFIRRYSPDSFAFTPILLVNRHTTDSVFNAAVRNAIKQDSLDAVRDEKEFNAFVKKEQAAARRKHKPVPIFAPMPRVERAFVYDVTNVKRYRIKVTNIIKESPVNDSTGPEVKTIDTITVLLVPAHRWDTTSSVKQGRVVVYYQPIDNKEPTIDERYFSPEMLDHYKREHIYFVDPKSFEREQWREVLVQY
ncbi:MAG: hypothetical protein EOP51_13935 [Sphingobacteriales bacterium]|nr:MAG: hypothetical protein EOP51_13935 [Sphingobacteriales bacterium]